MRKVFFFLMIFILFTLIYAAPTIDGDLSDSDYISIATGCNNTPWGGLDIDEIVYYPDAGNSVLYLGIVGKLNTGDNNGISLWIGFDEVNGGKNAGDALGGTSDGGHYMGNHAGQNDYKADFPVDYMFAMNTGSGASNVYLDVVEFSIGTGNGQYIGSCNQSGTSSTGPGGDDVFSTNQVTYAFNNDGTSQHGFEMSIPYSELGVTVNGFMKAFAFIVSSNAWFDDMTAPGDPQSGDLGINPDFNTLSGGPYNSGDQDNDEPLPVTLTSFQAAFVADLFAAITWTTQSESNMSHFNIYRAEEESDMLLLHTEGATNTTFTHNYLFEDYEIENNVTYNYWLEGVEIDGTSYLWGPITLTINFGEPPELPDLPEVTELFSNYPNPFNPSTLITFAIKEGETGTLEIFNTKGQVIEKLEFNEGTQYFRWNATEYCSGVYLYKLETGSFSEIKKMVLTK